MRKRTHKRLRLRSFLEILIECSFDGTGAPEPTSKAADVAAAELAAQQAHVSCRRREIMYLCSRLAVSCVGVLCIVAYVGCGRINALLPFAINS